MSAQGRFQPARRRCQASLTSHYSTNLKTQPQNRWHPPAHHQDAQAPPHQHATPLRRSQQTARSRASQPFLIHVFGWGLPAPPPTHTPLPFPLPDPRGSPFPPTRSPCHNGHTATRVPAPSKDATPLPAPLALTAYHGMPYHTILVVHSAPHVNRGSGNNWEPSYPLKGVPLDPLPPPFPRSCEQVCGDV